ncbi:hypothetical protein GALMADRAFT_125681 [Galerina marginata CBS 339.88]|uniref:Uncharacterized protein n=1 Tax=Galerina marginata (strain CBS 339.88) TaxID=685588 RepID=A0A067SYT9_GALM3|nr:hypothetical protein GALMADRAFT_125681 [Galerina marginata CBS 339.88]
MSHANTLCATPSPPEEDHATHKATGLKSDMSGGLMTTSTTMNTKIQAEYFDDFFMTNDVATTASPRPSDASYETVSVESEPPLTPLEPTQSLGYSEHTFTSLANYSDESYIHYFDGRSTAKGVSATPFEPTPCLGQSEDIPSPPAKFSDRLYTNYIPSATEVSEIKQYVSTINDKLADYDNRIAELQAALREINSKRDKLQDVGATHQALISPFRRLPPEILQVIFVWCLPQTRNAVMHASEAPVLLGRVCSEWRRISLATPEVWASLHIVPPNVNFSNPTSSTARFQRKRELIEMWLARSGVCPLSVSLVWFAGDSDDEVKLCGTLLEVLVPLCGRWKSLDFQAPLKMFKPFKGLQVQDVPLLEGISLMDNRTPLDADVVDKWPESLNFAESASNLRNFTLTYFSGGIRLPSIPWSQLTVLYLESNIAFFFNDSREMLFNLSQCSNLQSCTLKFPLSHTASLPSFEKLDMPVVLSQLQVLCVDGDQHLHNTFHMSNTLTNICAPKLRRLEILGRSGRPENSTAPEPLAAIRSLLQKSKCPLEKLNVESMTMLPNEFVACLRLVPSLLELVVHNWSVRVFTPPPTAEDGAAMENHVVPEDQILKALTIPPKDVRLTAQIRDQTKEEAKAETGNAGLKDSEGTETYDLHLLDDNAPLCPNLQRFDFTLCEASQTLLCDFVTSRWSDVPDGVARLKSVKCNFTAFEEDTVKTRMQQLKAEGLDAFVTYQVPISDDLNPSPWTGLEGPS